MFRRFTAASCPAGVAFHATQLKFASPSATQAVNSDKKDERVPRETALPPPFQKVGGVFIVTCVDHPFKWTWEINKMLRDLRFEYKGQTTIHPDIPAVRQRLWRTRNIVRIQRLDLDEAKQLVGIPRHVNFSDLAKQIPYNFGRTKATATPHLRSKMNFMQYRRMRMRDILHRDAVEKRLLEEKRKLLAQEGKDAPSGV